MNNNRFRKPTEEEIMLEKLLDKRDKRNNLIFCAIALLFPLLIFLLLLETNLAYYFFGSFAKALVFILPICAIIISVISTVFVFKRKKISFIIPVAIAVAGSILAFTLSSEAQMSKISGDFLKHETELNSLVENVLAEEYDTGIYDIDCDELFAILPLQKVVVEDAYTGTALFFLTLELDDRYEGYAYIPFGSVEDWTNYGEWSDALDIEGDWYYLSVLK